MRDRRYGVPVFIYLILALATTQAFFFHRAPAVRAVARARAARHVPMMAAFDDDDDDIRLTMAQTHMETGFLKRAKAQPLYENPDLLNAEQLNEIYGPDERDNSFLLRSMWTASCVFRLDGILIDSADLQMRAWERVADAADGRLPSMKQVFSAMHMSPDVAIRTVFGWTDDEVEARSLAETFDQVIMEELKRQDLYPIQGAVELIEDMIGNEVPCAVISNLPLEAIEYTLEQLEILPMIEVVEGYDGRLKNEAQLLLMACLEMERPPKHAVLFDFSAEAVDLAHENDMKAAVLDGLYYQEMEVTQCDAKLVRLTDWTMPRFRQLIEEYPFDEDELTMTAMATARAPTKRKISVATYDMYKYEKGPDGQVVPTQEYLENQRRREERQERIRNSRRGLPQGSRFLSAGGAKADDGPGEDDFPELPNLS